MNFTIRFHFFMVVTLVLSACGGAGGSTSSATHIGYVIDSPVVNLEYRCGTKVAKTETGGLFTCDVLPVKFFLGDLEIGKITSINSDLKVFIQDIVGLSRDNFTDTEVLKLGLFFQSLAANDDISQAILLPDNISITSNQSFEELTLSDVRNLLIVEGVVPRTEEEVSNHLQESSELAPNLSNATAIVATGSPIRNAFFTNTGGTVTSCSISPELPVGLNLSSNCTITGTATIAQSENSYTVTGTNASGSDTATVSITVNMAVLAPNLSNASAIVGSRGIAISSTSFSNVGGTVSSCEISPTLPTGLSLSNDCTITGIASVGEVTRTYTVTGSNVRGSDTATVSITINISGVILSGTITFDSVPFKSGGASGLDYNNITQKEVRGATVDIVDSLGVVLASTDTDANGAYSLAVTGTDVKVRVSAKLYKASNWNFQVKDNTNNGALYVMEGTLASLGSAATQTRDLNAASGWGGSSYTSTRTAAPFAILDVVYEAIDKITTAQSNAVFPTLDIFWSKNNIASSGTKSLGQITTSHYDGTALYILGSENSDTDEYDTAVIGHEWGHYYEDNFSRSDSIGGSHGGSAMLDIRLAFGEGFGTALGCMIIDSPFYLDSLGSSQASTGVFINLESEATTNAGWYNETSISKIIYDIFDSIDDAGDTLSLGFTPIHNVFIGTQKNTEAFTSIFTFITALKSGNSGSITAIDAITMNESIASIIDIYGTGRTNRLSENANPLYSDLNVGSTVSIVSNTTDIGTISSNKLGAYNFLKFTITTGRTYTIDVNATAGGGTPNPNIYLYQGSSSNAIGIGGTSSSTAESLTLTLNPGTYRMAIHESNGNSGITFDVALN